MTLPDLRLAGTVPTGWVARRLWGGGVYRRELLDLAEGWASLADGVASAPPIELVIPLALLRGARFSACARVGRLWVLEAHRELGAEVLPVAGACLVNAAAPDTDLVQLLEDLRALEAAASRRTLGDEGRGLLEAAAAVAALAVRSFGSGVRALRDGERLGAGLRAAYEARNAAASADLFGGERVDFEAFEARARLEAEGYS